MENVDEKQAFEVMRSEHIIENMWKVRGRNYKDIRTGDILYAHIATRPKPLPFQVVEIMAFGKRLSEVSYGYASELVVEGNEGENLSQVSHLYMA